MAVAVIMPRQGQSVESCLMTSWNKAVGDQVNVGDVLFSYETDKASFEEEASVSGTILAQFYQEGDDVPCLNNVCVIGNPGESFAEFAPEGMAVSAPAVVESTPSASANAVEVAEVAVSTVVDSDSITNTSIENNKISPRARALAQKLNIDYKKAVATGPDGRVIERDIVLLKEQGVFATSAAVATGQELPTSGSGLGGRATIADLGKATPSVVSPVMSTVAVQSGQASAPVTPGTLGYRDEKIPNIRKMIAKAMQNSLATTSQVTLNSSFDATEIMALRAKLKKSDVEFNVTLTDMILFAVSRIVKKHAALNAHFLGDTMRFFDNVHLGIAVDTDRGLLVPTVFNADIKSLVQISEEVKSVAAMSKSGTISPDVLTGASFTVTNLGTFGIESFTPVINPPQTGILGVNTIVQRVREKDGVISTYPAMGLSLTFDHGALDGAPAARFLQDLTKALENFTVLLMQ